jgi:hypothetical protein
MRFYNGQHHHYCGIDLHTKSMYLCILDAAGKCSCTATSRRRRLTRDQLTGWFREHLQALSR